MATNPNRVIQSAGDQDRRLYEAAPELLAALKNIIGNARFVPAVAGSKHGKWMLSPETLNEARAAIAKAEGVK